MLVAAVPSPVAVAQRQPADDDWPTAHPVTAGLEQATPGLTATPADAMPIPAVAAASDGSRYYRANR